MQRGDRGRISSTDRSWVQDAELAMGNDIVRGLIELVTNADDAYTTMGAASGAIAIAIAPEKRGRWSVSVSDHACGMRSKEMEKKLLTEGERSSDAKSNNAIRGHLGRGAKDVAVFGNVRFASVKGDKVSVLEIERGGTYISLDADSPADSVTRARFGLPETGAGTTVTINVKSEICQRPKRWNQFALKLAEQVQLRGILSDDSRTVTLQVGDAKPERLRAVTPPSVVVLGPIEVPVEGYAEPVILTLRRLREADGASDRARRFHGIVIRVSRAWLSSELFGLDSHGAASYIAGELDAPEIGALMREYRTIDPVPENPVDIVKRDRTGLQDTHPYFKALRDAVRPIVAAALDRIDDELRASVEEIRSSELGKDFDDLGAELAKAVQADLDDDFPDDDPAIDEDPDEFRFVPPVIQLFREDADPKTVSLILEGEGDAVTAKLKCSDPSIASLSGDSLELTNVSARATKRRSATVKVFRHSAGSMRVTAKAGRKTAELHVKIVDDSRPVKPERSELIRFSSHRYSALVNKRVAVRLILRRELVEQVGATATIALESKECVEIASGLNKVTCERKGSSDLWIGKFELKARGNPGRTVLTAKMPGDITATTVVDVRRSRGGIADIRISLEDTTFGSARSLFTDTVADGRVVRIAAQHFSLASLLGEHPTYEGQNSPAARRIMAEIIASEVARHTVTESARKQQVALDDAEAFYARHRVQFDKYLKIALQALVKAD